MRPAEEIKKLLKNVPVNTSNQKDQQVLDDILYAMDQSQNAQPAVNRPYIWRIIMQNKMTKIAVAAAILVALILGISYFGTPIDGAGAAFAAAMDKIKQARTFSCIEIFEVTYEDGGKQGKYQMKQKWMFREPDQERHETLTSAPPWPQDVGEVTIWNYGKRQMLQIRPFDKTAEFCDLSYDYVVDNKTGELKLTELDTSLRDKLLSLSKEAVEYIGNAELDDQKVRMFQAKKGNRVTTVWVNQNNNLPVQIEHRWTDQQRSPVLYTSIQIDTKLDDKLFSLEPPEGYSMKVVNTGWSSDKRKIVAKIMYLGKLCFYYASKNENQLPNTFDDLVTSGIAANEVLKKVLAAPDETNGPSVFRYHKPDMDSKDLSKEIMIYEIFNRWPDNGIVVCFADGHAEIISDQNRFEELIK